MDDGAKTSVESVQHDITSGSNVSNESNNVSCDVTSSNSTKDSKCKPETDIHNVSECKNVISSVSLDSGGCSDGLTVTNIGTLIQYDRETLLKLRSAHSAELWPAALHRGHVGGDGLWDPVKSFDLTRAVTPPDRRRGGSSLLSGSQDERKRGGSSNGKQTIFLMLDILVC